MRCLDDSKGAHIDIQANNSLSSASSLDITAINPAPADCYGHCVCGEGWLLSVVAGILCLFSPLSLSLSCRVLITVLTVFTLKTDPTVWRNALMAYREQTASSSNMLRPTMSVTPAMSTVPRGMKVFVKCLQFVSVGNISVVVQLLPVLVCHVSSSLRKFG